MTEKLKEKHCHVIAVGLLAPADIGGEACEGCPHNIHGKSMVLLSGVTEDVKKLLFEDCEIVPVGTKAKIEELNKDIETLLYYYNIQSEHLEDVDDIIQRRSEI